MNKHWKFDAQRFRWTLFLTDTKDNHLMVGYVIGSFEQSGRAKFEAFVTKEGSSPEIVTVASYLGTAMSVLENVRS